MFSSLIAYFVYFLFLIFPLGQLTRINLRFPEIGFYWQDILVILIVTLWLIQKIINKQYLFRGIFSKKIFGFFSIGGFSLLLSSHIFSSGEILIASLYLFRWLLYLFLYLVVKDFSKNQQKKLIKFLIFAIIISVVSGLLQYFFWYDFRSMQLYNWDPHYFRLVGLWFDPGYTSMIYVLFLIFILFYFKKQKQIFYFLFFSVYIALALTYARSAYLSFLAGLLSFVKQKKETRFFLLTIFLIIFTLFILPRPEGSEGVKLERTATIFSRIKNWHQTITIGIKRPLFGFGFNTYRYVQRKYGFLEDNWQFSHSGAGADASLLFIFATTGIIGLLVFLNLIILIIKKCLKEIKDNQNLKINQIVFVSLISLLIHSIFNNSLFFPWIILWLAVLMGLAEGEVKEYS